MTSRHLLSAFALMIGHRGAYLIAKGLLYCFYGFGLVTVVGNYPAPLRAHYSVLELVMPLIGWGALWLLVGVVSILAGLFGMPPPNIARPIAFGGLMFMATVWAVGICAVPFVSDDAVVSPWISGALFASLMASTAIVASWPDRGGVPQ